MATWKKWTSTVLVNGQPEPNVKVYVYEPGTTNEIPIYEDEGVTQITQPILTDSQGRYAFFVDVASHPEIRIYLEKEGVDFSEVNEDLDGVPVPGAGGTFIALTDTPSSYSGRGGHVVLVKTTEDGIETQPWPLTGTVLNFFLSDDAADIGSYYYMYPTESGDGYSELTSPSLSTGDDQLLWSFVTEAGEPGVEVLALGAYTATLFLKKTGNKDVRVYWKLFKRDTGGTETEILQSAVSDYLTTDNSQYLISAYLNEDQTLDSTDRLVLKLYANVSGTGTDVTVTLTMEGDYDSRITINVLSSAFNLDRLSDVTITSPADNELLAYNSTSGKWINQTPNEAGVLAADGSVPLAGDWSANGYDISSVGSLALKSLLGAGQKIHFVSRYASVQAAIDAASEGDTILFDKLFTISSAVSVNKSLHLLGLGFHTGIQNSGTGNALELNVGGDSAISGITIRNMRIEGNSDSGAGIKAYKCDFLLIFGNWIRNHGEAGIWLDFCSENPRILGNNIDCLDSFSPGTGKNNYGIRIQGETHDLIVANNQIEHWKVGLFSDETTVLSVNWVVSDNDFDDNIDYAIYIDGPLDFLISNNVLEGGTTPPNSTIRIIGTNSPFDMEGHIVSNSFRGGKRGVWGTDLKNLEISDNRFSGVTDESIYIDGSSQQLKVDSNMVYSPDWFSGDALGLVFVNVSDSIIQGNAIFDTSGTAITVQAGSRNIVAGNLIYNPDQDAGGVPGILYQGSDSLLLGNNIQDKKTTPTMTYGIEESGTADNNRIFLNTVEGHQVAPLKAIGGSTFSLFDEASLGTVLRLIKTNSGGNINLLLENPGSAANTRAAIQIQQRDLGGNPVNSYLQSVLTDNTGGSAGTELRFINTQSGGTVTALVIDDQGNVGVRTTGPGYDLDVAGDIHCTGKLTSDGGNDPPYVLYNHETRASIIERVKKEVLPDKLNGAVLFFNGEQDQLELFLPRKGEFRSLDGKILETVKPITETFETEDRYYLDEETGEIKSYQVRKPARKYRLKPDHELDPLTGKVKRKIKAKKKDPETGEEIEEIVREEEVALEEAIEIVKAMKEDGR